MRVTAWLPRLRWPPNPPSKHHGATKRGRPPVFHQPSVVSCERENDGHGVAGRMVSAGANDADFDHTRHTRKHGSHHPRLCQHLLVGLWIVAVASCRRPMLCLVGGWKPPLTEFPALSKHYGSPGSLLRVRPSVPGSGLGRNIRDARLRSCKAELCGSAFPGGSLGTRSHRRRVGGGIITWNPSSARGSTAWMTSASGFVADLSGVGYHRV